MTAPYQKPPEPASGKTGGSLSVVEIRAKFDTFPDAIKDLSMLLANEVRLVQSSITGLYGVPEAQVRAQVQQAHETLHSLEIALGMEQPEKP